MAETLEEKFGIAAGNLDNFFLIVMGCIVFLMQCGFAFLEAGAVRSKNTVNILIKNMLDCLIGGSSYWAIGWALAYGPCGCGDGMGYDAEGTCVEVNETAGIREYDTEKDSYCSFIGTSNFFSHNLPRDQYPGWFFQFVFAATAATIISGSVAERCHFNAYFAYCLIITGWVYPPVTHWGWDGKGWLAVLGYKDFAGSGIVHVLGGMCALVAAYLIGPRLGRFTKDGKPIDMPGHSVPLAGLGGFILLFGFLAFNGGSQLAITNEGDADAVGIAIVNTILGGCGGGLSALFIEKYRTGKYSYLTTLNGALTGMVSMCAGCNVFELWASLLIGAMAGPVFIGVHELMLKLRIDDPLDAVAVHMGGGTLGVLMVPFFMTEYEDGTVIFKGIFSQAGGTSEPWRQLGVNLAGLLAIYVWAAFWSTAIFGILWKVKMLRIDRETEFRGNDMIKHGESAYPRDAWVEMQYNKPTDKNKGNIMPHMSGVGEANEKKKSYNDAFEMMPTTGAMFAGMRQLSIPGHQDSNKIAGQNNESFEVEKA